MRNKIKIYLLALIAFLFISLGAFAQGKVYTTVSGNNVRFVPGKVILDKKNRVTQGVLAVDHPFAIPSNRVIRFQAGHWIRFDANAKVYEGHLAKDHPLTILGGSRSFWFKKGTKIKFDSKGLVTEGTTAKAIPMTLSNGRNVNVPAGTFVKYDSKGRVTNYNP